MAFCFGACSADDSDYASGMPDMPLSFSANVISFDTIFSGIDSPTKIFKIYNNKGKTLDIQSIDLMSGGNSGFRVNIDGESGIHFSNVEILKNDSLFGFIEVTFEPPQSGNFIIKDSIRFVTAGTTQYVELVAVGLDVYKWDNKVIAKDTTLTSDKPFLVSNSLTIKSGVKVIVEEGTHFYFRRDASFYIYGSVDMRGTVEKPVVLRGDRFDKITGNIPFDNVPGQWGGVVFYKNSYNNKLDNVVIKNSSTGVYFDDSNPDYKKASLTNTIIQNSSEIGFYAINCDIDATNNLFANTASVAVYLIGGKYNFTHCTIANYYRWSARINPSLVVSNLSERGGIPLTQCDIRNTIIYGGIAEELRLINSQPTLFNYQFTNCLIKGKQISDPHFENVMWGNDPLFENLNRNDDYSYNFQLQSTSPAIDKANDSYTTPEDINGKARPNGAKADLGCYEWYPD